MQIKTLDKLADKKRWMERFIRDYSGETKSNSPSLYGNNVLFLVAYEHDKELGFIRINDKSSQFSDYTDKTVWNLTDGYVKPPYRGKGVLAELIKFSIANHNVKMMYIETERYKKNQHYYNNLGFTNFYTVKAGAFCWVFQEDIWSIVQLKNLENTKNADKLN